MWHVAAVAVSIGFVFACSAAPPPATTAKTQRATMTEVIAQGGGPVALVAAVDEIADARCQREVACNRIGDGHRWATTSACKQDVVHEKRHVLDTTACESGYVDPDALSECIQAIHRAGCALEPTVYCDPPRICSM